MTAQFGAHEVMEIHEVLTDAINTINQFELYRPHIRDQHLGQMLDRHVQFMTQEYNNTVQAVSHGGAGQAVPFRVPKTTRPIYGLDNPTTQSPNTSVNQMDDRDVASGMLCAHKAGAVFKMAGALECADPNLRRMMQQSAVNCSELAYDVWQFMNQKGYYQVPTMKENTTNTVLNTYGQSQMSAMGGNQYTATTGVTGQMGNMTSMAQGQGQVQTQGQGLGAINAPGHPGHLFS